MNIDFVFHELKRSGQVRGGSDFSERWLGMEASYFRGLRAKQRQASARALATCAHRLRKRSKLLTGSADEQIRQRGERFADLADRCIEEALLAGESGASDAY